MRFEAFIASRYLRGKRKNRFVSLITLISVAGVSVGVMALIVVMSVMTGFDTELRSVIIGNRAHLTVVGWGRGEIDDPDEVIREIEELCPEIQASSPYIDILSIIQTPRDRSGRQAMEFAYIVGVDPERASHVTLLADNLTDKNGRTEGSGRLPDYKEIVLGYILANKLGVRENYDVIVLTPRMKAGVHSMKPTRMAMRVSGISQAQMSDFDTVYGFIDLKTAKALAGQNGVDGIQCKLDDPDHAKMVSERIEEKLGYRAITWYESEQAFFEALVQEKVVMFIILLFIILVAAFNITSTLIMVVMEKRRDIGILRTIGVSSRSILQLFMLEGLYIGMVGTLTGVALGTFLAYNLNPVAEFIAKLMGVDLFSSQIYFFDRIPVAVVWTDVLWITVCSIVLTFISTLYPAWSAARLNPVDALRYE